MGKKINTMEKTLDFRIPLSEKAVYRIRFQEFLVE